MNRRRNSELTHLARAVFLGQGVSERRGDPHLCERRPAAGLVARWRRSLLTMRGRTILKIVACGLAASIWGSGTAARAANGETVGLTDVGGGKIEYVTSGRRGGEPVVFLHGGWMAFTFAPMAAEPALAQYRLIRIHRRGYAGSSDLTGPTTLEQGAADVAAVLDDLGIRRAHVVAHSWGGLIAIRLAKDRPDLVQSLILFEPGPLALPENAPEALEAVGSVSPPDPAILKAFDAGGAPGGAEAFVKNLLGDSWQADLQAMSADAITQLRDDADEVLNDEILAINPNTRVPADYYKNVAAPALVVWGSTSPPQMHLAAELLPDVQRKEVEGAGHMMPTQMPKAAAEIVAAFIRRHPIEPGH